MLIIIIYNSCLLSFVVRIALRVGPFSVGRGCGEEYFNGINPCVIHLRFPNSSSPIPSQCFFRESQIPWSGTDVAVREQQKHDSGQNQGLVPSSPLKTDIYFKNFPIDAALCVDSESVIRKIALRNL